MSKFSVQLRREHKYSSFCSPRLHPACPISSSVQVQAGRPLPSRHMTRRTTSSCVQLSAFPVPIRLPKNCTLDYLDFWIYIHRIHSPLVSASKQSFPKTLLSNHFLLFQHLSSSVLLLRKWYNRIRWLHQRCWGRVMETIYLQCCYKDIPSSKSPWGLTW